MNIIDTAVSANEFSNGEYSPGVFLALKHNENRFAAFFELFVKTWNDPLRTSHVLMNGSVILTMRIEAEAGLAEPLFNELYRRYLTFKWHPPTYQKSRDDGNLIVKMCSIRMADDQYGGDLLRDENERVIQPPKTPWWRTLFGK